MIYRFLGNSGLKVSEVCLGVMTLGGDTVKNELATVSQKEAEIIIMAAFESGINFFVERIGNNYGKSVTQTAINWLLRRPAVNSVIIGARNAEQLKENAGASGWQLSPDDVEYLDKISKPTVPYPVWHQSYSDVR